MVGYMDIPDPRVLSTGNRIVPGLHGFIVLSRSTIGAFEPVPDPRDK